VSAPRLLSNEINSQEVFVFKMFEVGHGIGVDLVKRMQPGGDLKHAWIVSDHVKRVAKWTTMVCHVYDGTYQRVMTIVCCDFNPRTRMLKFFSGITSTTSWPAMKSPSPLQRLHGGQLEHREDCLRVR
jgi:hypothetical protein